MKVSELSPGARFRVVGIGLELELLERTDSGATVRPTRYESRRFHAANGEAVEVRYRPRAFRIALSCLVEEVP